MCSLGICRQQFTKVLYYECYTIRSLIFLLCCSEHGRVVCDAGGHAGKAKQGVSLVFKTGGGYL